MLIRRCPYSNTGTGNLSAEDLGKKNIVALHVARQDYIPSHTAPFSFKYVLQGSEIYECENHRLSVRPNKYLIINKNQTYSSEINSEAFTSSLCVFFSDQFISDGVHFATHSNEYLLDNPFNDTERELNFSQKLFWADSDMDSLLNTFNYECLNEDLKTDELCSQLLGLLLVTHKTEQAKKSRVAASKHSTKQELYKRLCSAVDFIHENYDTQISLTQLSKISCISSFHFLRAFKQVFRTTPHQYITSVRLQYACKLLRQTELPVSEVCFASGFQDVSSFTRLFRANLGATPRLFKKAPEITAKS